MAGKSDPFNTFGHGIKSYFDLLQTLVDAFCVLTILVIPVLVMNSQGAAMRGNGNYALKQFSFGNMG
jgi:hypothetical protein